MRPSFISYIYSLFTFPSSPRVPFIAQAKTPPNSETSKRLGGWGGGEEEVTHSLVVPLDFPLAFLEVSFHPLPAVRDGVYVLQTLTPHDVQRRGCDLVLIWPHQPFTPGKIKPALDVEITSAPGDVIHLACAAYWPSRKTEIILKTVQIFISDVYEKQYDAVILSICDTRGFEANR